MATKQYHYVGLHADTLYKGDKAIPVGHGMDAISISDEDFEDERNAHLVDSFIAVQEVKKEVKETKQQIKEGGDN